MSRTCHSLTRHNPRAARASTLSSESTPYRSSAGGDGPMAPGARSQPNKLARTAMFVLTRSRCSQSAGKVPTCEAACQRRWACTSRGYLLCHQRPGPDRRQNGVRASRCAAAAWRAASACERTLDRWVREPRTERRPYRLPATCCGSHDWSSTDALAPRHERASDHSTSAGSTPNEPAKRRLRAAFSAHAIRGRLPPRRACFGSLPDALVGIL